MATKKAHPIEKLKPDEGLRLDNLEYQFSGGKPGTPHAHKERFYSPSLLIMHDQPQNSKDPWQDRKEVVGRLSWHGKTGAINMIEVHPKYRGLKVATHMLELAKKQSSIMGVPEPVHSDLRTPEGDDWAKSTSMDVPPIRSGVCRDCSKLRSDTGECECTEGPQHMRLWRR
jgi:hypothetical protein